MVIGRAAFQRCEKHAILVRERSFHCERFHHQVRDLLQEHQLWHPPARAPAMPAVPDRFGCMICQRAFRSKGREGAHMFRCHGVVNPVRHMISGTQCSACLKEYHTTGQLKAHLLRSRDCRVRLLPRRHGGPLLPGVGSVEDTQRQLAHDGRTPPLQAFGPHPFPLGGNADLEHFDLDLHDDLALRLVDFQHEEPSVSLERVLRDLIMTHPVSWTVCQQTLWELYRTCQQEPDGWHRVSQAEASDIVQRLSNAAAWPFLDTLHPVRPGEPSTLEQMEQDCLQTTLEIPATSSWVPRPCGRHQVVLHAFSGRRRPGDIQFYMEKLFDRAAEGVHLTVVSLDIVTDKVMGDASATQDFWFHHTCTGAVAGFFAGPPCETWSVARFAQPTAPALAGRRCPRPVRSISEIWGLHYSGSVFFVPGMVFFLPVGSFFPDCFFFCVPVVFFCSGRCFWCPGFFFVPGIGLSATGIGFLVPLGTFGARKGFSCARLK